MNDCFICLKECGYFVDVAYRSNNRRVLVNRILHLEGAAATIARKLPFTTSMRLVELLLHAQGIGAGENIATSGEKRVFDLISSEAPVLFDVGGHVGAYSRAFLRRVPEAGCTSLSPPRRIWRWPSSP